MDLDLAASRRTSARHPLVRHPDTVGALPDTRLPTPQARCRRGYVSDGRAMQRLTHVRALRPRRRALVERWRGGILGRLLRHRPLPAGLQRALGDAVPAGSQGVVRHRGGRKVQDAVDVFAYCPGHPGRAAIEERIGALGVDLDEIDEGVRFGSGLYRVGEDIQPVPTSPRASRGSSRATGSARTRPVRSSKSSTPTAAAWVWDRRPASASSSRTTTPRARRPTRH